VSERVGMDLSIVIPVYNQIGYTRICIESLLPTLAGKCEIIIISNGSTDDTGDYISGFPDIKLIVNKENRGCAFAWNQGVMTSTGQWVAILNNDIILSRGWFEGLLAFAEKKGADIACPAYREGEYNYDIADYSTDYTRHMQKVSRMGVAHGICFMVHRRVFERIGLFDEKFRVGQYEDADFFRRARHAGFTLGITGRSFIHHFGSATQKSLQQSGETEYYGNENRAYYRNKHGLSFLKRFLEKRRERLQAFRWRMSEKIRYGHTLIEKWYDRQPRYF